MKKTLWSSLFIGALAILASVGCSAGADEYVAEEVGIQSVEQPLIDKSPLDPRIGQCDAFDLACQQIETGKKYAQKLNNPTHYSSLSVHPGSGSTGAMFIAGGVWIYADYAYWGPDDLLHRFWLYDWSIGWVSFGEVSAHPSAAWLNFSSINDSVLSQHGVSGTNRENLVLGLIEVLASSQVVNQGLLGIAALGNCDNVETGVQKGAQQIASFIVATIAAQVVGNRAGELAREAMGGLCPVEAQFCCRSYDKKTNKGQGCSEIIDIPGFGYATKVSCLLLGGEVVNCPDSIRWTLDNDHNLDCN